MTTVGGALREARLRVLLADDHEMVREGLAVLINAEPDMAVVAQAATGHEALHLAQSTLPDVAVVDLSMPGLDGVQATERLRAECPRVRVLVLTRHTEHAYVRRLLQAGAAGYIVKKSAAKSLIDAIRTVANGGTYVEAGLAGTLLQHAFGHIAAPRGAGDALTAREEEVLRAIAWGRSNKQIAADLGLSVKTVESYKASAAERLGLRSRADIVRYAVARGWLADDGTPE